MIHRAALLSALLCLLSASAASAQVDPYQFLYFQQLKRLPMARDEAAVDFTVVGEERASAVRHVFTRIGGHLVYWDLLDSTGARIDRTGPLPISDCLDVPGRQSASVRALSDGWTALDLRRCDQREDYSVGTSAKQPELPQYIADRLETRSFADVIWLRGPTGMVIALNRKALGNGQSAVPLVYWAHGWTNASDVGEALRTLFRSGVPDPAGHDYPVPMGFFADNGGAAMAPLGPAVADAVIAARSNGGSPAAFVQASDAILPLLHQIDWRDAPLSVTQLNDLAYMLQLHGGCDNLWDAALMLRTVIRRDPTRAVAHLNLADVYAGVAKAKSIDGRRCVDRQDVTRSFIAAPEQIAEEYRQYCWLSKSEDLSPQSRNKLEAVLHLSGLSREDCRPRYPLFSAIENGDMAAFNAALADPHTDIEIYGPLDITALGYALEERRPDFARALLMRGADPNRYRRDGGGASINAAIRAFDADSVQLLLAKGFDLRRYSNALDVPFLNAAILIPANPAQAAAKARIIDIMAAYPFPKDVVDSFGENAIHIAVKVGASADDVRHLASLGVPANVATDSGWTPLFVIPAKGASSTADMVVALLKLGVDPNKRDVEGNSALMWALKYRPNLYRNSGSLDSVAAMVKALLDGGADPSFVNKSGENALSLAAQAINEMAVRALIRHGARPVVNARGESLIGRIDKTIGDLSVQLANAHSRGASAEAIGALEHWQMAAQNIRKMIARLKSR